MPPDALTELAADAYVYGYPLVADLTEVNRFAHQGMGSLRPAPLNTFSHADELAGPADTFVSVNNDTLYSIATVDVSAGPVTLHVPDTGGDYYVIQIVDAWTNNIAYIGRRATGTREAEYLLVPADWPGHQSTDSIPVSMSTDVVSLVGRIACAGADDVPRVRALQRQFTLSGGRTGTPDQPPGPFFEQMRYWMAAFPPSEHDRVYQERFRPLGLLGPGDLDEAALEAGAAIGRQRIEDATHAGGSAGGWVLMPHAFDYNLDYLGLGTINTPEWRIDDREASYRQRAAAARAGLWGNHGYEASYAQVFVDDAGETLTGERSYTITFASPPPVDAFWSITMYGVPDYYLVANPIDRYSIGDRTAGLDVGSDGSVTIVVQPEPPAEEANWLPAPVGAFRPVLRMYQPRREVLDGTYQLPPFVRRR